MEELWLSKILDKKEFFSDWNQSDLYLKIAKNKKKIETDAEKKETDELMN